MDEKRLLPAFAHHGVLFVAGMRASRLGLLSAGQDEDLRSALAASERRAFFQQAVMDEATDRLEAEGIRALPLKGPTLALAAHGSPGMRTSNDLDILVDSVMLQRAQRSLAALGYSPDPRAAWSSFHVVLTHPNAWRPPVELHWRLHWYGGGFAERLLRASRRCEDGVRRVGPAASLACLLFIYARDGFAGLRLAADIAAFVDAHADRIAAADFRRWNGDSEVQAALHAAAAVADHVVGLGHLRPSRSLTRSQHLALRLANWPLAGDPDQINATVRLVDLLLAPRPQVRRYLGSSFRPFVKRRANAKYMAKTFVRWVPAGASAVGGQWPHPLPGSPEARAPRIKVRAAAGRSTKGEL